MGQTTLVFSFVFIMEVIADDLRNFLKEEFKRKV